MNQGFHHLHKRKQIYQNLEPYPHTRRWKRIFDRFMYLVGTLGPVALLPQIIQVWFYRNTGGISLATWSLLGTAALLWCVYGIIHRERPIIVSNIMLALFNFAVVVGVLLYR